MNSLTKSTTRLRDRFSRLRRRQSERRGAAVVEFAVMAPILVLVILGTAEYGRMVMVQQLLTNACREGARHAMADGATTSSAQAAVQNYLSDSSMSAESVLVEPDPSDAAPGDPITVTVNLTFDNVAWMSPFFLSGETMSARASMRREGLADSGSPPGDTGDEDEEEEDNGDEG